MSAVNVMGDLSSLLPALGLYAAAHALRITRLAVCLGVYRPPGRELAALHCVGVALSYRLLPAFCYEALLLAGGAARRRDAALPMLYSLLILRLFDALTLVVLLLLCPPAGLERLIRPALMLLTGVALLSWFGIAALPPLLLRLERRFLRSTSTGPWALPLLRATHALRLSLNALGWRRRGTVSFVLVLSALSWGLEWQALALLAGSAAGGAADLLARVGGSLGLRLASPGGYAALASGMWPAALIASGLALRRLFRPRRLNRLNRPNNSGRDHG